MTRSIKQTMKDALPFFYENSRVASELMDKESDEIFALSEDIKDLLFQFFVDTATWGLSYWEKEVGITTNPSLSYEDRRGQIKAKIRGTGTMSLPMIETIAKSYTYGAISVTEFPELFEVHIKFIDERGIPTNLELLKQSLSQNIPAHLKIAYEFTYMSMEELSLKTWDDIDSQNGGLGMTWNELVVWR